MPRRGPSNVAFAFVACLLALSSASAAQDTKRLPLELEWSAPPECPGQEQVERDLERMARPREGRSLEPLAVYATITRLESGNFQLSLRLKRNGEERESHFDGPKCPPLAKAASLVLALAFGDGVELEEQPTSDDRAMDHAAQVTPAAEQPGQSRDAPTSTQPAARRPGWRLMPWASAVASSGFIGPALGAESGLSLGGQYWGSFVRASAFPPQTAAARAGISAELSAVTGALGGCSSYPFRALRLDGCVALELGVVRAHSSGAARDGSAQAPWLALAPSLGVLLPLPRPFALRAELAMLIAMQTPRYDVEPYGTVYGASPLAPRASLGLAVEL